MIKNEARAEINDVLEGIYPLVLEVNFSDEYKDCVRVSLAGKFVIVKYTDLFSFMFTLATKEQQAKMIPVQQELGYEYMKTITIKATKDLKKGELITVHTKIHVPTLIEEKIREELATKPSPYVDTIEDKGV